MTLFKQTFSFARTVTTYSYSFLCNRKDFLENSKFISNNENNNNYNNYNNNNNF